MPACLPNQLINATGQRIEIKITSTRQSFRALSKRARDVRNGLEKISRSPQRASLLLTSLGTVPLPVLQPGVTRECQRYASQRRANWHKLGYKVSHG